MMATATRPAAPADLPVAAWRLHRFTNGAYAEMGRPAKQDRPAIQRSAGYAEIR